MIRTKQVLKHWRYQKEEFRAGDETGKEVGAIHTWNIEEGLEDYAGSGWYRHELKLPQAWQEKRVWVCFGAVYHDAIVYLNGTEVARHENAGYTPFTVELTKYLVFNENNQLDVFASNAYSKENLPYLRSFDWANDGGMIREAYLYTTGEAKILAATVNAKPVIETEGKRQEKGGAVLRIKAAISALSDCEMQLDWELFEGTDVTDTATLRGSQKGSGEFQIIEKLQEAAYWHFDNPALYTLQLTLKKGVEVWDRVLILVGFREFRMEGDCFYLNGEKVRLCGTEWMPGSNPAFGMAESKEQIEKMLQCLKESNCVFTRFHWQQDEFVYDWCDRHGMLVQEEVPFWGCNPPLIEEQQKKVFRQQAAEMIEAHGNHPSIIAWGVGNELPGQEAVTIEYIKEAVSFIHSMEEERMANYISNSFYGKVKKDGTVYGDVLMLNEYCGTWMEGDDAFETIQNIITVCKNRPLVISEFGLCEPTFSGGDEGRIAIFTEKMELYRKFPQIAGTINFCLNDYRTQMGEEGEGKYRCRVHGSAKLDGTLKPSYAAVQKECAPFKITWEPDGPCITCKADLPCYEMKGYLLEVKNDKGLCEKKIKVPDLCPGESFRPECKSGMQVDVYRKNGDWAGVYVRSQGQQ